MKEVNTLYFFQFHLKLQPCMLSGKLQLQELQAECCQLLLRSHTCTCTVFIADCRVRGLPFRFVQALSFRLVLCHVDMLVSYKSSWDNSLFWKWKWWAAPREYFCPKQVGNQSPLLVQSWNVQGCLCPVQKRLCLLILDCWQVACQTQLDGED